jgi:hypothetical protein
VSRGIWKVGVSDALSDGLDILPVAPALGGDGPGTLTGNCARVLHATTMLTPVDLLPITVGVQECGDGALNHLPPNVLFGPFLDPSASTGEPSQLCAALVDRPPSAACSAAKMTAGRARSIFELDCSFLQIDKGTRDALQAAALAAHATAAALFGVGAALAAIPVWGLVAAGGFWIAAGLFAAIATGLTTAWVGSAIDVGRDQGLLSGDGVTLEAAIMALEMVCCPQHLVDAEKAIPTCA